MSARWWIAGFAAALSVAGQVLGCVAAPAGATSDPTRELVAFRDHDMYFSPNGDGRYDRARFEFSLSKRSSVRVLVRDNRQRLVRSVRLGSLKAGPHVWRWDGASSAGKVLPDGQYQILVKAWSGERSAQAWGFCQIVTVPDAGQVVLTRPVVYPAATAVVDRLAVSYIRARYDIFEAELPGWGVPIPLRTRLVITAHDGERVHVAYRRGYRPSFFWSARDEAGKPLPPGTYLLRLTVKDPVGNVRTIRRLVDVSSAQLAEQVWTSTTSAAATSLGKSPVVEDPSCQSCGEVCGPVPSERFPGGLSFRHPCNFYLPAVGFWGASPPLTPAPVDSFRITATGGPTTLGGSDSGTLDGVVIGPGDATVSTPWQSVNLTQYPYLPDARQPVNWGFSTANNYDLASFTVEYRYYTPVP